MLALVRHVPAFARLPVVGDFGRELYMGDRNLATISDECGVWDAELTYLLKPGGCTFSNTEFRTAIRVNSARLRGSEEALRAPEIIVLGDSYAMGWGVEEPEAFTALLAAATGRRVLNAGVASFGTVRELKLLSRLDLSHLSTLLIQFCNNDYVENEAWARNGGRLPTLPREEWEGWVRYNEAYRRYWPGRYLFRMLSPRLEHLFRRTSPEPGPDPKDPVARKNQVDFFIRVMEASPVDLSRVDVIVFELNGRNQDADWFGPMLREAVQRRGGIRGVPRFVSIDVAPSLGANDFFVLDEHLNAAGHRKVAGILLPYAKARTPTP
jgi:hypothetical protein